MAEAWNDSYYSLTINSSGYRFYGSDAASSSPVSIFISTDVSITTTAIRYSNLQLEIDCNLSASGRSIKYVKSSLDGLASVVTVSLDQQKARSIINIESSLVCSSIKDAYSTASLSSQAVLTCSAIEIQYASTAIENIDLNASVTSSKISRGSVGFISIDSQVVIDSSRVRLVSASLSIESSVNVGSYKFARALIDGLIDGNINVANVYKETSANAQASGELSISSRAIEIQYASIDQVSAEFNIAVSALEIIFASTSASIESDTTVTAYQIQYAISDLQIDGYVLTVTQEIVYPQISISGTSDLNATAHKIVYSRVNTSVESNLSAQSYKLSYAKHESQITSDVVAEAIEILYAQAVLHGMAVNVTVGKEILLAKISINGESAFLIINPTRFSNNIVEDTQNIRTMLVIDNKPITEHNRKLSSSVIQPLFENINWKNTRNRYYKSSSGRKTFSLSWTMLPNSRENTVDLKFARDIISQIGNDPDIHNIKVLNIDSNGATPHTEEEYNVIVKSYNETLRRRDLVGDEYWWDCSLELEEV